ncbi:MAG: shikimate dehydrogenase [Gammaproteobacteria bacterium]
MTDRYAVMGNPIGHSKSPQIHSLFARQTGQDLSYEAMLVPVDEFAAAVSHFCQQGGHGLNVTVPFKQQAWELATQLSERAERAGAVNTLTVNDGVLTGENTDGVGLVRDLTNNHAVSLSGKQILLLGAGGAARGVIAPLIEQSPATMTLANRTVSKAIELADQFSDLDIINGCGFSDLAGGVYDIIINATAAGLSRQVPDLPAGVIKPGTVCYDMMYSQEPTAFMEYAHTQGAGKAVDGLGMLVEQAAESFYIWRGVRPETAEVIKALRA